MPRKMKNKVGAQGNLEAEPAPDRPAKRVKIFDQSDSEDSGDGTDGVDLKVNEEFAKRFEYNKKREELQRLEGKYGKGKAALEEDEESEEDSEEDIEEDDEGELVTEALDAEIMATLQAIRNKDPRVYKQDITFYSAIEDGDAEAIGEKKEKAMTLKDYHMKNLLEGKIDEEDEEAGAPRTYAQEQEDLKRNIVKEMHAAADEDAEEDEEDEDGFLVRKLKAETTKTAAAKKAITDEDVANADKDPDTFLSNFMTARAWKSMAPGFAPLESDDEDEEKRADAFEEAYNLRFEDPEKANETLRTHARDAAAKYSVRREELSGRKKLREKERAKKEAEKAERDEEKARLRKLKIEEMEAKVKRIREAAGLTGKSFNMEEWVDVLEADWDDDKWEDEMRKRFGDDYYTAEDAGIAASDSEDEEDEGKKKKKKPKKPKWDDDIDIKDLVPDFEDDEEAKPSFSLSDLENDTEAGAYADAMDLDDDEDAESSSKKAPSKKDRLRAKADAKASARRDRRLIESLVDQSLPVDLLTSSSSAKKLSGGFRYRETSPTTFGLTPRDILLASDSQLNQFAGLKKMAAFRDPAKKAKDRKKLGKKARLREWRRETFGQEDEPAGGFERLIGEMEAAPAFEDHERSKRKGQEEEEEGDIREGERKKKRKRAKKSKLEVVEL